MPPATAKAGGIDALVFSGGIGEHTQQIRTAICEPLAFLGFSLDHPANTGTYTLLHASASKPILLIAADEASVIRDLVMASMLAKQPPVYGVAGIPCKQRFQVRICLPSLFKRL